MRCSQAGRRLQLYVDKQLTFDQMRALEAHLLACTACRGELLLLEEIEQTLHGIKAVAEPPDLTVKILQRVALTPQHQKKPEYMFLRPSLSEMLTVVLLATIATLGLILEQPSLREVLPIANGHDILSLLFVGCLHMLASINSNTLMLMLWVVGTILGVWITLALAGNEVRNTWFKAMMERLPVW